MLGRLLGAFIVILVGVNLLPVIANAVAAAATNANTPAAAQTIIGLTTLFFSLAIMSLGVSLAIGGLRDAELI